MVEEVSIRNILNSVLSIVNRVPQGTTISQEIRYIPPFDLNLGSSYWNCKQPARNKPESSHDLEYYQAIHILYCNNKEPEKLMYHNGIVSKTLKQGLWKRCHAEYLTSLQQRSTRVAEKTNVRVGSVALVKEPQLPPRKWILARITQIHPGKDHRVRVVSIKTETDEYMRPITKLVPLPFSERRESFSVGLDVQN